MLDRHQNYLANSVGNYPGGQGLRYLNSGIINTRYNPNPYGLTFENEKDVHKMDRIKYKEDLDYLVKLKQGRLQEESNEKSKENYEVKAKSEMQRNLYDNSYMTNKALQMNLLKEQQNTMHNNEERRRLEKEIEKTEAKAELDAEIRRNDDYNKILDQKNKWTYIANKEYNNYLAKQNELSKIRQSETEDYKKYIEENNKVLSFRENEYKSKLENMNQRIYKNLMNHSDYLTTNQIQTPNEPYYLMNDLALNKQMAMRKEQERSLEKKNPYAKEYNAYQIEKLRNLENMDKEKKMTTQKYYKEYLDKQYEDNILKKSAVRNDEISSTPNLIMPSYNYPSRPVPIYKKAMDSIHLVKNNLLFENQNVGDMKQFFNNEVASHTLIDQHDKRQYISGTDLKHNPIVNPLPNLEYNKYIARQNRELVINNQNNGNQINSYENMPHVSKSISYTSRPMTNEIDSQTQSQSQVKQPTPISYSDNYVEANQEYRSGVFDQQISRPDIALIEPSRDLRTNCSTDNFRVERNYGRPAQNMKLAINSKMDLIKKMKDRVKIKGVMGVYSMRKFFENLDFKKSYMIDFNQFCAFIKEFSLGFSLEETKSLFSFLDDMKVGLIRYEEFLSALVGELQEPRKSGVVDLYNRLSRVFQENRVDEQIIKEKFNPRYHPDVTAFRRSEYDVTAEFTNDFNLYFHGDRVSFMIKLKFLDTSKSKQQHYS